MAKTAKLKKNPATASKHSRAARRAASPSLDLDKSITSMRRPEETPEKRPSILATRQSAGVSKKQKTKAMSRQQRRRHEKGLQRAEMVLDKTEKKVAGSVKRNKTIKDRRGAWEDLNKAFAAKSDHDSEKADDQWEDVEEEEGKATMISKMEEIEEYDDSTTAVPSISTSAPAAENEEVDEGDLIL